MSTTPFPATSREIRLAARPDGLPRPSDFALVRVARPVAGPADVLVRNRSFRVSSSARMMISGAVTELDGVPFPGVDPGETLHEQAIGEVLSAPAGSGLRPGDLVAHWQGWREYAAVPVASCTRLDGDLPDPDAHLSHAWTTYAALRWGVELRPGATVFVTGATGAIGSTAAQLARLLGAGRVVGSTGSPAKADRLVRELGYDATVPRGADRLADRLAAAAPDGIDVLLDTVGGEQLAAAVTVARPDAQFVLVGALSGQLAPRGTGATAPVELDSFALLLKRITVRGFSADLVDAAEQAAWPARYRGWLRTGELTFPHVRVDGLENAPQALCDLIAGRHLGTVVVRP